MKIEIESITPSAQSLNFVRDSIREIKPESPDLFELHQGYVQNHIERITNTYAKVHWCDFRLPRLAEKLGLKQ